MKVNKFMKYFFLTSVTLLILLRCSPGRSDMVAWVNDQSITVSELQHWMLLNKANTYNYFYQKYDVEDHEHFWIQKYGEEVPLMKLKKVALEKAVRCKIQQILALERGIIESANYDHIINQLDDFNSRRRLKASQGEPIYGPEIHNSRTYFSHILDVMVIKLKHDLASNELSIQSGNNISGDQMALHIDTEYANYLDKMEGTAAISINNEVYKNVTIN